VVGEAKPEAGRREEGDGACSRAEKALVSGTLEWGEEEYRSGRISPSERMRRIRSRYWYSS
jgi:hypothetical protein